MKTSKPKSKRTVRTANIYKKNRPVSAAIQKKIRTAATRICLENGVECLTDHALLHRINSEPFHREIALSPKVCYYCECEESELGDDQLCLLRDPETKKPVLTHESCHDTATSNHENYEEGQM